MRTRLTELLGIDYPIFSAPMGPDLSGPELVAAVSGAGGLGILQRQLASPAELRASIRDIRQRTEKPFGVNFLLPHTHGEQIDACLDEGVSIISFFWGDPTPWIGMVHAGGALVCHQVGSVAGARRAVDAGVDVIIAQGMEAGGHVDGDVSTLALVPRVVDEVMPIPVAAAGGIADGRGIVASLSLGAQAAVLGTAFLATLESRANPVYKEQLLRATESETVKTTLFGHGWPNAPHRCLRTPFVEEWLSDEARGNASRPDEPVIGATRIGGQTIPLQRFMGFPPNADATGDIESMSLLAGQSVGMVRELIPAGELVRRLVAETAVCAQNISKAQRP